MTPRSPAARNRATGKTGARPRTRSPAPFGGRVWIGWTAAVAGLLAVAWWVGGRGHSPPASHPLDTPAAQAAYRRGLDAAHDGRYLESLPDFRAAAEARPDLWNLHHDYASALLNAVHQGHLHLGHAEFVLRSSYERVRLLQEGLAQLDDAARLARDPHDRAQVYRTRAQILRAWGLTWNAFLDYRTSQWADTTWRESARMADAFTDLMEHPTQSGD